jgi:hypothetical protein
VHYERRLGVGDALAAQGKAKIELWHPDGGEVKISRTVFADQVLALKAPPRERKKMPAAAPLLDEGPAKEETASGSAFFNDDIPFEAAL